MRFPMVIQFLNIMKEKIIKNYTKLLLGGIVLLAVVLRFYALSTNPPALTWDEVSWGYNAYTLGISGKDEFGKTPTTYLESFGDFKPPAYAYLSVIPVWIFGLNEFSTRFVSAFFGVLTVFITYFLTRQIFSTSKFKNYYALGASFVLAISPWHILLSRGAFEANVATFFITFGVFLFLFSTQEKKKAKYLVLSLLSFVVAMYTFNTSRVFLPPFVLILFILKYKILLESWRVVALSIFIPLLVSIPLALFLITPQAKLRYEEVNIFSDIKVIERVNLEAANAQNIPFSNIIYNRRFAYLVEYVSHYLDNLNPSFLFIKGDGNPKFSIQDVGQMYIWELPFLLVGTFLLFRKKEGNWIIIPFWLILGIMPAATARETPHALRIETVLPTFQILVAYGIVQSYVYIKDKNKKLKSLFAYGVVTAFVLCFMYFIHTYFNHYPVVYASEWQYGYKEAVQFVEDNKNKYKNIYFTKDLGRPYMYVLFYGKYPPDVLINSGKIEREALGFVHVNELGKYKFAQEFPGLEEGNLYITTEGKVPGEARIVKEFYQPDGKKILIAYEK